MSNNDAKIKSLMAAVEKQKAEMGWRPRVSFETNGLFSVPYGDGKRLNLNTVADPQTLVLHLSQLLMKEKFATEAAEMLKVDDIPFKWDKFTVAEWAGDFKQQIDLLKFREKKAKLDKLNQKLSKLISEDARTAMELEEIEKLLG